MVYYKLAICWYRILWLAYPEYFRYTYIIYYNSINMSIAYANKYLGTLLIYCVVINIHI